MNKPYVICHMLASLDGKIDGDFFSVPECAPALRQFGKVRDFYDCSATLYGTTTMEGGYADGRIEAISKSEQAYPREDYVAESDVNHYIVSLDSQGVLAFSGKYLERRIGPKRILLRCLQSRCQTIILPTSVHRTFPI